MTEHEWMNHLKERVHHVLTLMSERNEDPDTRETYIPVGFGHNPDTGMGFVVGIMPWNTNEEKKYSFATTLGALRTLGCTMLGVSVDTYYVDDVDPEEDWRSVRPSEHASRKEGIHLSTRTHSSILTYTRNEDDTLEIGPWKEDWEAKDSRGWLAQVVATIEDAELPDALNVDLLTALAMLEESGLACAPI